MQKLEAGLLEEHVSGKTFTIAGVSNKNGYNIKKIYIEADLSANWVKNDLPQAEIVTYAESILHDTDIDLVLMPASQKDNLEMVSTILTTGKNLRIV